MVSDTWLRFYKMPFARVYPAYIAKAERKGRSKAEVDEIIRWLTGYSQSQLEAEIADATDVETFYTKAPAPNAARSLITGTICGDKVQDIEEPLRRECRYLDKLIDDQPFRHAGGMSAMRLIAKGKAMEKILRAKPGRRVVAGQPVRRHEFIP